MIRSKMFWLVHCLLASAFFVFALPSATRAALIEVSQESSAGAGDFDANVLGTIQTFNTPDTTLDFYAYGANSSFNGPVSLTDNTAHLFLVDGSDGLSLFLVLDNVNDGSGGNAVSQITLTNDTASVLGSDDAGEASGGPTVFNGNHNWIDCCTDGYLVGTLEGNWEAFVQFSSFSGLSNFTAVSDTGANDINLALESGREVRLRVVPVPPAILMAGFGVLGLIPVARRKRKRKIA